MVLVKALFSYWNRLTKKHRQLDVTHFVLASPSTGIPEFIFDLNVHAPRFIRIVLIYKYECLF